MRFKSHTSLVTAIAVLTASTFQFGFPRPVCAHHVIKPPPIQVASSDNVKDFGALGDGITDDTAAINNAAADALANHKGVFFPAGNYLHASPVTFNSVAVSGVGGGSVLKANNPANCAVILTGSNVSIQNMVISTQGLSGFTSLGNPNSATLLLQNATSFTVASDTIATGTNLWGALVLMSTVGSINSVALDGTGHINDFGVAIDQGDNVTVANSLFQNDSVGVEILPNGGPSQFIAVLSNTIGDVTWPITQNGVQAAGVNVLDIAQNTIQTANSSGTFPVLLDSDNDFVLSGNNSWGGTFGFEILNSGAGNNLVTQNLIHNCGAAAIALGNIPTSAIQVTSNAFGECGLLFPYPVILISGGGADASGFTTFVQNNSYQGHLNNLTFYVECLFTKPHIPASNVSGNTQTQTALANSI